MKNYNLAYLLGRTTIGMSMFAHGFIRLTKLSVFSEHMVSSFSKSMLPMAMVKPFSMALPFFEFGVGVLLLLGLFTRQALVVGCLVMMALLFGSGMVENWDVFTSQLMHSAFFIVLIMYLDYNYMAVDNLIRKKKTDY